MADFTNLLVWKTSHLLALEIYKITRELPKEELFGLVSQIRRASVSVVSNIAEGETRYTAKDKLNFFIQARSSIAEVKSQLLLIKDLYKNVALKIDKIINDYEVLGKQLNNLITYRRKTNNEKDK